VRRNRARPRPFGSGRHGGHHDRGHHDRGHHDGAHHDRGHHDGAHLHSTHHHRADQHDLAGPGRWLGDRFALQHLEQPGLDVHTADTRSSVERGLMCRVRTTLTTVVTAVLLCAGGLLTALDDDSLWSAIAATVPTNSVPADTLDAVPMSGTTVYLVVGSDRRAASSDTEHDVLGARADAIMLVAVRASGTLAVLSVPRDVRVHLPGHGDGKLGGALNYGRPVLIDAVRAVTDVPVHHYVELDFATVTAAADALGGIPVTVPRSARDAVTGLRLDAGRQQLDGPTALAFVRSRHYEEFDGRAWTTDGSGDLGRIARQHQLLVGVLAALRTRCPSLACAGPLRALGRAVTVDGGLDGGDLRRLATAVGSADLGGQLATVPTSPERPAEDSMSPFPPAHPGNAVYRVLDQPEARAAVARLVADPAARGR
jgi:LCP family protein required for cell wall assembly